MQRLIKITSFLLLAIWLPATLHCDMEAAGLAETHRMSSVADDHCKADLCASIENSLIRESAPSFDLAAPAACDCLFCLASFLAVTSENSGETSLSVVRHVPPREIAVGWQFLTRAAPPSRAPSLNA